MVFSSSTAMRSMVCFASGRFFSTTSASGCGASPRCISAEWLSESTKVVKSRTGSASLHDPSPPPSPPRRAGCDRESVSALSATSGRPPRCFSRSLSFSVPLRRLRSRTRRSQSQELIVLVLIASSLTAPAVAGETGAYRDLRRKGSAYIETIDSHQSCGLISGSWLRIVSSREQRAAHRPTQAAEAEATSVAAARGPGKAPRPPGTRAAPAAARISSSVAGRTLAIFTS